MKTKADPCSLWQRYVAAGFGTLFSLLVIGWLAGCAAQTPPLTAPAETSATPTVAPIRPTPSPAAPAPSAQAAGDIITLTWWTPEFLSPQASQAAGPTLAQQLAEFELSSDGRRRVDPVLKARYGKGGLLDLLRTAQPVAPAILPDLVTLDVIELEQAVMTGLLQPLDGKLNEDAIGGLYQFARSAGEFEGKLLAVQYVADFEHVAYLTDAIRMPPQSWKELLGSDALSYLFALGVPQASADSSRYKSLQDTVLSQYLSAGVAMDVAKRRLFLEETPLLRLLGFYRAATDAGLLPPNALGLGDVNTIWDIFAQGRVPMAQVSARRYLAQSESVEGVNFAVAPGESGPVVPVASGWALGVVTTDPIRQQAAADLISWLLQPDNAGALSAAMGWLPTSPAALETWGSAPYYEFVDEQLAAATNYPIGPEYSQVTAQLHKAIVAVLSEGVSPQDAIAAALEQPR